MNLFLKYALHPNSEHRQAAVYGLGVSGNGGNTFVPFAGQVFESLCNAAGLPPPKTKSKRKLRLWGHAHDNSIAAMGKAIKAQEANLPSAQEWVARWASNLPL